MKRKLLKKLKSGPCKPAQLVPEAVILPPLAECTIGQNETFDGERRSNDFCVDPTQQIVLTHLLAGATVKGAAEAVGIGRSTAHRWLKEDPAFIAAYHAGKSDLLNAARMKLFGLLDKANACLEKAIETGDARAALAVIRLAFDPTTSPPAAETEEEASKDIRERHKANAPYDPLNYSTFLG